MWVMEGVKFSSESMNILEELHLGDLVAPKLSLISRGSLDKQD
jgi:hypothetical protein